MIVIIFYGGIAMKKRKLSFLAILIVILSFCMTVSITNVSLIVGAEGEASSTSSTTKYAPEQPYSSTTKKEEPITSTTTTTKATTTTTTTKPDKTTSIIDIIGGLTSTTTTTTTTTTKPNVSEQPENPSEHENPSATSDPGKTTTKPHPNKTTTIRKTTTKPATTVPKITIPQVDNTEIEGTVLDPLDAYFERLTGDTGLAAGDSETVSETTQPEAQEDGFKLGTVAIIAICLGGIAVLTCVITGILAVRNKKQSGAAQVEYDDEYEDYDAAYSQGAENAAPEDISVNESSDFTVVSLDDTQYKD